MNQPAFTELDLPADLLKNLESLKYHQMTPVQSQALPLALAGSDAVSYTHLTLPTIYAV